MAENTQARLGRLEADHSPSDREALREKTNRSELVERITKAIPDDGRVEVLDGLTLHRSSKPTEPLHSVSEPALCVMAQGAKRVHLGDNHHRYDPYHYLLVTSELPIAGEIVEASRERPYLSMILSLDANLVSSVMVEAGHEVPSSTSSVRALDVSPLDNDLLSAMVRLIRLLDSPNEADILAPLIRREIIFRLLQGEQGQRLRHMAVMKGSDHRIARVIQRLHDDFDQSLNVERLAEEVGMSTSSFYTHFKSVTDMTPLQFQKQLRLQEARRLMLSEDLNASTASYRVGYNNDAQFNREYKRLFGRPPMRDVTRLRASAN